MPTASTPDASCTVTICRGCHCGTVEEVPDLDHGAQLAELTRSLKGVAKVRTVDCLDQCEQANVIVVQPSPSGRRAGGRISWLARVNQSEAAAQIVEWVRGGGPGLAERPGPLGRYAIRPPRTDQGDQGDQEV